MALRVCALLILLLPSASYGLGAPNGVRVNKVFTATYSRRESDRLVAAGRVAVNGATAKPGDRVHPGDTVTLDGQTVESAIAFVESTAGGEGGPCAQTDFTCESTPRHSFFFSVILCHV